MKRQKTVGSRRKCERQRGISLAKNEKIRSHWTKGKEREKGGGGGFWNRPEHQVTQGDGRRRKERRRSVNGKR